MVIHHAPPAPDFERTRSGLYVPRPAPLLPFVVGYLGAVRGAARGVTPSGGGGAATFGAIGTVNTGTGTSVTTSVPSGTNNGRILVLNVHYTTTTVSTPSGWNLIGTATGWFGDVRVAQFWRLADGGADDAPTLTLGASEAWESAIVRVEGADTTTPVDTSYASTTPNSADPITLSDVTVANNGSLAIAVGGNQATTATAMTDPAPGYTVRAGSTGLQSAFFVATADVNAGSAGGGEWDWPGVTRPVIDYCIIKPA